MPLSQLFVDPSVAPGGDGSIGNPYGSTPECIVNDTFDTTNGTQVNVRDTTDDILVAGLETYMADTAVTPAWVPTETAPLVIRGYTSAANDGGLGSLNGGGSTSIFAGASVDFVTCIDMKLHNTGANVIADMNNYCGFLHCSAYNSTGGGLLLDVFGGVYFSRVENVSGFGIEVISGSVSFNFLKNGVNKFSNAINAGSVIARNVLSLDGSSNGIRAGENAQIEHNTIWANGGSGSGILGGVNNRASAIINNVAAGFSAVGGHGYDMRATGAGVVVYGGNASYDNETHYSDVDTYALYGSNEVLTAQPFTAPAADNFAPVQTGEMQTGSLPSGWFE